MSNEAPAHCCAEMTQHLDEGEVAITYWDRFRDYGIKVLDGGSSVQSIYYCPWCGDKLSNSLRDEWFDLIDQLGLEPGDAGIPDEFLSAEWWQRRGL